MLPEDSRDFLPEAELGVLFVHGIGEQQQGDTLQRFGEPLNEWLDGWLSKGADRSLDPPVRQTDRQLKPGDDEPARIFLHADLPTTEGMAPRRLNWLLAECWWQGTFSPPTGAQIVRWAAGFGPRTIVRLARRQQTRTNRLRESVGEDPFGVQGLAGGYLAVWFATFVALPLWFLMSLITAILAILGIIVLWIALVATFLPLSWIPGARRALERLQLFISNSLGDTYLLVRSSFSGGAMVERMHRDLDWLEAHCGRIVVVAHSQGAVIAQRALSERNRSSVAMLVTLGSPLRILMADLLSTDVDDGAVDAALTLRKSSGEETMEWIDFYATMDPVAWGPLWVSSAPPRAATVPVSNFASPLRDHASYWRNLDGFVAPLVVRFAGVVGARIDGLTPKDSAVIERAPSSRQRRVTLLLAVRYLLLVSAFVMLPLLGGDRLREIGTPVQPLVNSLPLMNWGPMLTLSRADRAWLTGAVAVLAVGAALYLLAWLAWSRWTGHVVRAMYARSRPQTPTLPRALVGAIGIAGPFIVAAATVASTGFSLWSWMAVIGALVAGVILMMEVHLADLGPPPPAPLPVASSDILPGLEFAYRDGATVRHVRVVESDTVPALVGVGRFLRTFFSGGIDVTVEMLDDNRPPWWRGGGRPRRGERVFVSRASRLVASWTDYGDWCKQRERWKAA